MNGMLIGRWPAVQKECAPMSGGCVNVCFFGRSLNYLIYIVSPCCVNYNWCNITHYKLSLCGKWSRTANDGACGMLIVMILY